MTPGAMSEETLVKPGRDRIFQGCRWLLTGMDCLLPSVTSVDSLANLLFTSTGSSTDSASGARTSAPETRKFRLQHNAPAQFAYDSTSLKGLSRVLGASNRPTVLCCSDDDEGQEAVRELLFLATLQLQFIPEVKRFSGSGAFHRSLSVLANGEFNAGDTVVLLSATRVCSSVGVEGEPPATAKISQEITDGADSDQFANFHFAYIALNSKAPNEPNQAGLAVLTPLVLEELANLHETDRATGGLNSRQPVQSLLCKEPDYPWRAVAQVVASNIIPAAIIEDIIQTIQSDIVAEERYAISTGMPFSFGHLEMSLLTNPFTTNSAAVNSITAMICAALTLHQKIQPPALCREQPLSSPGAKTTFCANSSARPWIHPVSPVEPQQPRRALLLNEHGAGFVLEEVDQGRHAEYRSFLKKRDSELFVFCSDTLDKLCSVLSTFRLFLDSTDADLADLAASVSRFSKQDMVSCGVRVAVVAESASHLVEKISLAELTLTEALESPHEYGNEDLTGARSKQLESLKTRGIYFGGNTGQLALQSAQFDSGGSKLAFILPGLGAAYPDMLIDLCFHFPEVREAFDFVDRLALKSGDRSTPSKLFFPVSKSGRSSNVAILATMDSAVISVILAEWALFRLLCNFGVTPDCILGCSTGEFASLAMNGCIDILEAAEAFYRLSTTVARSVPLASLSNLRSICVAAAWNEIAPLAQNLSEPVYLSAEMSLTYSIISGPRKSMDELGLELESRSLDFYPLPVAIPYHTPLVAGKVNPDQDDVQQLRLQLPDIPT